MASYHFDKLFSLSDADELIPRLSELLRELHRDAARLRAQLRDLAAHDQAAATMDLPKIIELYPELGTAAARMAEIASEIESFGCILKDLEQGLVDFPCELDNEIVFLCWQFGEPQVIAWHPVEAGFMQRQPLPGTAKPYLN